MKFTQLHLEPAIVDALELMNYKDATAVQEQVIPLLLQGERVLARAQTGSGKTAAFAIPLCQMLDIEERDPQVLILAPTRELALQIKQETANIGKFRKVRVSAVYGRHPVHLQQQELRQRVHVVVGTPGRVLDLIQKGILQTQRIRQVVLDEADEMLSMGFIDQVDEILSLLPKEKKIHLFSATMPPPVLELYKHYATDHKMVEMTSTSRVEDRILHQVIYSENAAKEQIVHQILYKDKAGSSILFCNTRDDVEVLATFLEKRRYRLGVLHGGLSQRERFRIMNQFKKGEIPLLVATNVAARGIDVEDVTHVINYQVPYEKESLVHRIGRTGRMDKTGLAITLVGPAEVARWKTFQEELELDVTQRIHVEDLDIPEHARVGTMTQRSPKLDKSRHIRQAVGRIRINGGKKIKIRPVDVMGAIGSIPQMAVEDIGIIDIQATCTYVEIFNGKAPMVAKELSKRTIKGRNLSVKLLQK
ncbi:DEAD/DEAH box helicase [Alkalibacter rhizosphaerae]|uniref:DEAD/DEAH box helicase n=1 Tax=Alkalibacter rhizosphaerae TaxID=2815577 RepID=A0A974XG12_9FIRM|nr:DEAD/DEAH box helicase [Alkalibacter rhizosphaerae]QSX09133.1 DEAD/DEAH box helicase [Alkalibacter rhizosphaerae]